MALVTAIMNRISLRPETVNEPLELARRVAPRLALEGHAEGGAAAAVGAAVDVERVHGQPVLDTVVGHKVVHLAGAGEGSGSVSNTHLNVKL